MVVHNPIMAIPGENPDQGMVLARVSGDRQSIQEYKPITPEEIKKVQNEIGILLGKFGVLMNTYILPLRAIPSSGTPPPPPSPTPNAPHPEVQTP